MGAGRRGVEVGGINGKGRCYLEAERVIKLLRRQLLFLPFLTVDNTHFSTLAKTRLGFEGSEVSILYELVVIGWKFCCREEEEEEEERAAMRKSFKDSLKALEADIQYANTLASDYQREYDGACFLMRLSYSPAAHLFLFLVQWTDCHLAGALGLLRILIYKAYVDGKTTMSIHERKASIREFYGVIFPSLLQLQKGITDVEERKQRENCAAKYKRKDDMNKGKLSEVDVEREEECGICMEISCKVVLPNCSHSLCMKCYRNWRARSQSCPFCRDSLKRVNSGDLWIYMNSHEIDDLSSICRENLKRLFMYIDKLPLIVPDPMFVSYDPHFR